MQITSNNIPRFTIEAYELTDKERLEFDWIDWAEIDTGTVSETFIRYKGQLYSIREFTRCQHIPGWHGYNGDSYYSGVLIRLLDDGERVVMGRYTV